MANVVKIEEVDGEKTNDKHWHYVYNTAGCLCALCTLQVYLAGDINAKYQQKDGKITCPECREIIKKFKAVKL